MTTRFKQMLAYLVGMWLLLVIAGAAGVLAMR